MKNNYIKDIMKEYEEIRRRNEQALDQRIGEVYKKIPTLRKIDSELASTGAGIARITLSGTSDSESEIKKLKDHVDSIRREKAFLLTENNFPLSYLNLQYDCENCKDTGFDSSGTRCSCFKQKLISKAYHMSNIESVIERENFKTFNLDLFSDAPYGDEKLTPKQNISQNLSICEGFTFTFKDPKEKNLILYGQPGLGKTFLCNCIAKALIDKGYIVVYQTAFKILEILEKHKFSREKDFAVEMAYNLLFDSDLLIIDDLGTEMTNAFTNSELFNILNSRLLASKKTVVSTNLSRLEMSQVYSYRISSRINAYYTPLKFFGKDIRLVSQSKEHR
ncbi:MAG: ATP-binding protein [Peptostreptococcaceae bacterium]|nr:ATP-binding protein [Peptostreptococcaceae bacterium]